MILNFLAAEGRLSTQHIDCIWAAAQVYTILLNVIAGVVQNNSENGKLILFYIHKVEFLAFFSVFVLVFSSPNCDLSN